MRGDRRFAGLTDSGTVAYRARMDGYRLVLASDVTQDGIGLELYDPGGRLVMDVFEVNDDPTSRVLRSGGTSRSRWRLSAGSCLRRSADCTCAKPVPQTDALRDFRQCLNLNFRGWGFADCRRSGGQSQESDNCARCYRTHCGTSALSQGSCRTMPQESDLNRSDRATWGNRR